MMGASTQPSPGGLREALNSAIARDGSGGLHRATSTATSRARRHKRAKPLGLLPLVALCFYDVSGGPFGIEVGTVCKMNREVALCFRAVPMA